MITPQLHTNTRSGRFAIVVTSVLSGLLYLFLVIVGVPESPAQPQEVFKQVDLELLTRIEPEPEIAETEESVEEPEPEVDAQEPQEIQPDPPAPRPEQVSEVPQKVKVDLEELLPDGLDVELPTPSNPDPTRPRRAGNSGERTPQRIELEEGGELGGYETLQGLESPTLPKADRPGTGSSGPDRLKIDLAEGSGSGEGVAGQGGSLLGGGDVLGGPKGRDQSASGSSVEVGLQELESFGDDYADVDFRALVEWMKLNSAELPVAVKQRMQRGNWDQSLLSSRVSFTIGDRSFDLLLMCKEELYEVHIMLVESVAVTYLIDRSFRQESNQLVTGSVSLGPDQDISVVSSRMRPASDQRNKEFYSIFLSWWDSVKNEVQ